MQRKNRKKVWRFEKAWIRAPESEEKLTSAWAKWGGPGCGLRLSSVCQSMGRALQMTTMELRKQIEGLKAQLEELMENSHEKEVIDQIKGITGAIEELEAREEEMWYQRSRQNWLTDGDKNTAFFHQKATQRRRTNTIHRLQTADGQ